jgi:hypothetical protein
MGLLGVIHCSLARVRGFYEVSRVMGKSCLLLNGKLFGSNSVAVTAGVGSAVVASAATTPFGSVLFVF